METNRFYRLSRVNDKIEALRPKSQFRQARAYGSSSPLRYAKDRSESRTTRRFVRQTPDSLLGTNSQRSHAQSRVTVFGATPRPRGFFHAQTAEKRISRTLLLRSPIFAKRKCGRLTRSGSPARSARCYWEKASSECRRFRPDIPIDEGRGRSLPLR
jgi:hypothetical protein